MPSRVPSPGDPTAPASASPSTPSSSATPPVAPASASAMECSVASQVRRPAPDVPPNESSSSSSGKGKKARLHGPDLSRPGVALVPDDDVNMRSSEECKTEVGAARPPPASAVQNPAAATPALVSSSTLSSSSSSLPASQMSSTIPVWASLHKLRAAGLDPRVVTSLVVDLDVDTRACPAPLVLRRVYSCEPIAKLAAVAALLGDAKAGFAIIPPVLPRALLSTNADARADWSAPQQAWYQELASQTRESGELVREPGADPKQRSAALTALFALISSDRVRQLWPTQELTSGWADLLCPPSAILQDRAREVQQTVGADRAKLLVPEHSYRVRLCCPTAEVTYAVAGCVVNYGLLPREMPEIAKRLRAILAGNSSGSPQPSASAETSASETDSSEGDGEWQTQHSHRRAAAQQRRHAASRGKQLAAFAAKELATARCKEDSARPLLQLASRVTVRSWQHHFVECFVSNWQSVGCRDQFAEDDAAFQRVVTAVPELQDAATVRWHLHDHVGGTLVSLFVRDDLCAQLPKLNVVLRQLPGLQEAALKVVCDAHPRRARGQRFVPGDRRRYVLTPEEAPSVRRPSPSGVASSSRLGPSASPLPSWAAVLSAARPVPQSTARRSPPQTPLDHRPRKEQRREPATISSAPMSQSTTTHPAAPKAPPAAWEARIAALEARLNGIQALCDSLRDVPRMLASIQQKLDLQLGSPSSPSLPCPSPQQPAASTPDRAPAALLSRGTSAPDVAPATAELSRRLDAQETLMERMSDSISQLARWIQTTPSHGGGPLSAPASSSVTCQ